MRSFRLSFRERVDLQPGVVVALLIAILAWHATIAAVAAWWFLADIPLDRPELLDVLGWRSRTVRSLVAMNLLAGGFLVLCEGLLAFVLWRLARLVARSPASFSGFALCWWRGCLIATVLIPLVLLASRHAFDSIAPGIFLCAPLLVVLPAVVAGRALSTPQRWRPVCPECGHSVLRAVEPRCSECGEPYPNPDPYYRRWAIRRLAWDQRKRTLLFAYINTVFCIVFRPGYTAWHLSIPDRIGRAVRWTIGHFLFPTALVIGLLGCLWLLAPLLSKAQPVSPIAGSTPADLQPEVTFGRVALWLATLLFTWWLAAIVYPVMIASALSMATPWIHPAARRGMIKWALYLAVLPPMLLLLLAGTSIAAELLWPRIPIVPIPLGPFVSIAFYRYPQWFLAAVLLIWGLWWAIGVAAQPYLRRRGFFVFVGAFCAYLMVCWLIMTLFDRRGFEALLV